MSATVVVVVDPGVVGAGVVVTQLGGVQYPGIGWNESRDPSFGFRLFSH